MDVWCAKFPFGQSCPAKNDHRINVVNDTSAIVRVANYYRCCEWHICFSCKLKIIDMTSLIIKTLGILGMWTCLLDHISTFCCIFNNQNFKNIYQSAARPLNLLLLHPLRVCICLHMYGCMYMHMYMCPIVYISCVFLCLLILIKR